MHIIVDGLVTRRQDVLRSETSLGQFLDWLVRQLEMRTLGEPHIVRYDDGMDSGLSAVQFIMTSSITVHTYPEISFIYIDLFSCRDIPNELMPYLQQQLGLEVQYFQKIPNRGHTHLLRQLDKVPTMYGGLANG